MKLNPILAAVMSALLVGVVYMSAAEAQQISPAEIAPLRKNMDRLHSYLDSGAPTPAWESVVDEFRDLDAKIAALSSPLPFSWISEIKSLRKAADASIPDSIRTSAENDVPLLFKDACAVAPYAFKPLGSKEFIHNIEVNAMLDVTRDLLKGSVHQNIERRLRHALVGYALLDRANEAEVKRMGKQIWNEFCLKRNLDPTYFTCSVALLASKDPARLSRQLQKAQEWQANSNYVEDYAKEDYAFRHVEGASNQSAALRSRNALKRSCEQAMVALANETREANALTARSQAFTTDFTR